MSLLGLTRHAIPHESLEEGELFVEQPNFLAKPRIVAENDNIAKFGNTYNYTTNSGNLLSIKLSSTYHLEPKVEINGEKQWIARRLRWYEWIWISWPMGFVVFGGALGAAAIMIAVFINLRVMYSKRSTVARFGISALVILVDFVCTMIAAVIILVALRLMGINVPPS